jgi:hypothetical protein
MSPLR